MSMLFGIPETLKQDLPLAIDTIIARVEHEIDRLVFTATLEMFCGAGGPEGFAVDDIRKFVKKVVGSFCDGEMAEVNNPAHFAVACRLQGYYRGYVKEPTTHRLALVVAQLAKLNRCRENLGLEPL